MSELRFKDITTEHPCKLNENELIKERDRLTELLNKGELTGHAGRRLQKVRDSLREIEILKLD